MPSLDTVVAEGRSRAARLVADGVLLALTAAWGLTFVSVKEAVARIPVFTFLSLRFGLAVLTLAVWAMARGEVRGFGPGGFRAVRAGLATGLALFAGYALQTAGLAQTSASRAGFITGLSVTLVPLLEAGLARARPDRWALGGVGLVAAGLALMFWEPSEAGLRRGDLLVLGCAAAFAVHVMAVAHLGRRHAPVPFTLWQAAAVGALSLPAAWLERGRVPQPDPSLLFTLLLTGVLVSGLGLAVQAWAQRHTSATHAAVIFSLEPVFAAAAGAWLGGEQLAGRTLAGGATILAGMLLAELGRLRQPSLAGSAGQIPVRREAASGGSPPVPDQGALCRPRETGAAGRSCMGGFP